MSFLINDTKGISSQNECIIGPGSEAESRLMFLDIDLFFDKMFPMIITV